MKNKSLIAFFITVLGWVSLLLGDLVFGSFIKDQYLKDILIYIIPFIFIIILVKKFNLFETYKNNKKFLYGIRLSWPFLFPIFFILFANMGMFDYELKSNWIIILIELIILCLCIGFFEESLFRNIIFKILDTRKAIWISSLLFGLIHIGNLTVSINTPISVITQVIYAFMMGVLFQAIYNRTKNIYSVIFIHAVIDFTSYLPKLFDMPISQQVADINLVSAFITLVIVLPALIVGYIYNKKDTI